MFDQVFDNLRKATEMSIQMQQELLRKWIGLWPGVPTFPAAWPEQVQQFQKKWAEAVNETLQQQRESTETSFKAGLASIEKAFQLGEAKSVEELRAKTLELWQKCFESLCQASVAQLRDFHSAMLRWTELVTKSAA